MEDVAARGFAHPRAPAADERQRSAIRTPVRCLQTVVRMLTRPGLVAALGLAALLPASALADPSTQASPDASGARTAAATTSATTVTMEIAETPYDGLQVLLDEEARLAMNEGKFRRAAYLFWRLLEIDPDDVRALRESGRVAQALGSFEYSIDAFARLEALTGGKPDPEIHYLRGEALFALGRKDEAEREWSRCEQELAAAPLDRQGTLWLARIDALRGKLGESLARYQTLVPIDRESAEYADVAILQVEAYILSKEWKAAERELRAFLVIQPEHARAKEVLAWVLESRGKASSALPLRAAFAEEWTEHPRKTLEYARSLERNYKLPAALARYREARALGVPDVDRDIDRLDGKTSPELAAGYGVRSDGGGDVTGWTAGANLPLGGRHRVALNVAQDTTSGGLGLVGQDRTTSGALWGLFGDGDGDTIGVALTARDSETFGAGFGGSAMIATSQDRRAQLQIRADYGQAWRESATTVREGGVADAASAVAYVRGLDGKLLFSAGVQGRRLALAPRAGEMQVHAAQVLGIGGLDYTLTSEATSNARGEILGEEMTTGRSLTSSIVLSYRHYEMSADDPFGERLTLVTRSSLDEVSATMSQVVDHRGAIAAELRGGVGRDWLRDGNRYRAGASLMLSFTKASRLTLDYDVASETYTGLVGRRHAGSAVLHVDL